MKFFDRSRLDMRFLSERVSKSDLSILIDPNSTPPKLPPELNSQLEQIAVTVTSAREKSSPIVFAFGAHLIKNGLSRILIRLMEQGYVQHILGNGAVSIHDWELAFCGVTGEDVERYVIEGQFGLWKETGYYINTAISENADLGYGSAVGKLIWDGEVDEDIVSHPHKENSILGQAYHLNIPVSICPWIGYDIIHTHPSCEGAMLGHAAYLDFLKFVETISNLEGGVYISIGSAITSPMVFEKAMSMARNVALQGRNSLEDFDIVVNDIQPGNWNWSQGEPPKDNPAYYLRFMKTFSRMPGRSKYVQLDNKAFLHNLYHLLQ